MQTKNESGTNTAMLAPGAAGNSSMVLETKDNLNPKTQLVNLLINRFPADLQLVMKIFSIGPDDLFLSPTGEPTHKTHLLLSCVLERLQGGKRQ